MKTTVAIILAIVVFTIAIAASSAVAMSINWTAHTHANGQTPSNLTALKQFHGRGQANPMYNNSTWQGNKLANFNGNNSIFGHGFNRMGNNTWFGNNVSTWLGNNSTIYRYGPMMWMGNNSTWPGNNNFTRQFNNSTMFGRSPFWMGNNSTMFGYYPRMGNNSNMFKFNDMQWLGNNSTMLGHRPLWMGNNSMFGNSSYFQQANNASWHVHNYRVGSHQNSNQIISST